MLEDLAENGLEIVYVARQLGDGPLRFENLTRYDCHGNITVWTNSDTAATILDRRIWFDSKHRAPRFNVPLWIAAIDFSKAFDSINHRSIFEALREHNVPLAYVDALSRLYKDQVATVRCDCKSRTFGIFRGTKQGDPISPYIFNSVLEQVLRPVQERWRGRKYGIDLIPNAQETLTI